MKIDQWELLAQGNHNVVFNYQGNEEKYQGKVMRITKELEKNEEDEQINTIMKGIFEKYLKKIEMLDGIMIENEKVYMREEQKIQFKKNMWNKIKGKKKSRKGYKFEQKSNINLMPNLLNTKNFKNYTFVIELKPKTPVYDKYKQQEIQEISLIKKVTFESILENLSKLPEKYCFKKYKNEIITQKRHKNNLFSCQFFRGELINYLGLDPQALEKYYKQQDQISRDQFILSSDELNLVINQVLNRSNILNKLLAIIGLFNKSPSRLKIFTLQEISQIIDSIDQDEFCQKLVDQTIKNYTQSSFKFNNNIIDTQPLPTTPQTQFQQIFQYLISKSFCNMSVILTVEISLRNLSHPIQINSSYSATYKTNIIDYQLKPYRRVKQGQQRLQALKKFLSIIQSTPEVLHY